MRDAAICGGTPVATAARPALLPLVVRGLGLKAGDARLIDGIDLTLSETGITVIMGPNGAGKSLLLRLLHGLLTPSSGHVEWGGAPMGPEVMRRQALVFQKPILMRRSVAANVDFVMRARGARSVSDRARRDALLRHVGLQDRAAQPARLLSGGEQQRLALARALATRPDVLFLDEPTANLDPASVFRIEEIVRGACAAGTKIIFVTHDVGQARRLADDVLFLHRGKVAEHRPASAFFARPVSQVARDYLQGRIVL